MKKVKINPKTILIVTMLCIGVGIVIFAPSPKAQIVGASVCWAVAVFVLAWITYDKGVAQLEQFDIDSKEALLDLAEKGESSEYYGIDIEKINKERAKIHKKNKKQVRSCLIIGVVLLLVAIIAFV